MSGRDEDSPVIGEICDRDGLPVAGALVRAFTVGLQGECPLGEDAISDADGRYRICAGNADEGEQTRLLNVRVAVMDTGGTELVTSAVQFGVDDVLVIDLELPGDTASVSELDRHLMALAPHLDGVALSDVTYDQLAFLIAATGIGESELASVIQASACAARGDTSLDTEVWYAWERAGLEREPDELWRTPTAELLRILRQSIDDGVVSSRVEADLEGIGLSIEQLKLDQVLAAPALGTETSLGALLDIVPSSLDVTLQRALADVAPELRPEDPQLVEHIAGIEGFDVNSAAVVARILRLGALTDGDLRMAEGLQSRLSSDGETGATLRPLTGIRPEEWIELAYTHAAPGDASVRPAAYAETLATRIEEQYPTATLAAQLNRGGRLTRHPLLAEVGPFLERNPAFDILTANVHALTEDNDLGAVGDPAQLVEGLSTVRRLKVLGATWDESATLLEHDIASAEHLVSAGPGQLSTTLVGTLAAERVVALHDRAQSLHDVTFGVLTAAFSSLSGPRVLDDAPAINHGSARALVPRVQRPTNEDVVSDDRLPLDAAVFHDQPALASMLQQLFGPQDMCACGHCGSVLSPAAYLVDLLKFVDDAVLLERLFSHRPDLQDIELSCDNTNTEVPAIDLALEVLENAIALPLDIDLPTGMDILAELDGRPIGSAVTDALKKTVRKLSGNLRGLPPEYGGNDWTIVDGHRRWTVSAWPEDTVHARNADGKRLAFDVAGLDVAALVDALDGGRVLAGAEAAFAGLWWRSPLDGVQEEVTVVPIAAGTSWRATSRLVVHVVVDRERTRLGLQSPKGRTRWTTSNEFLVAAVVRELTDADADVPLTLVGMLLAAIFGEQSVSVWATSKLGWTIESVRPDVTLSFRPSRLTVTSLAYQSGEAGADAVAWPENRNPEAYERLKVAVFPWSLPLDLPLEEARLFLERARCSRRRLLELLVPERATLDDDERFALEVLGLSASEAALIAPAARRSDARVFVCWGLTARAWRVWDAAAGAFYEAETPLDLLKNVSILLQQSQLELEALRAIVATDFVRRGGGDLAIKPQGTCVPSEMRLDALTVGHLDRIHRFARLLRRLGWTAKQLDGAIGAGGALDAAMLRRLAHLSRLGDVLGLPLSVILGWWDGSAAAGDVRRGLAQGLRLSAAELDHALGLLGAAADLFTPGEMLQFCERVAKLGRPKIAFEDLRYLLQHVKTPGSDVALDAQQITLLADAARDAALSIVDAPATTKLPLAADAATTALADVNRVAVANATRAAREDAVIAALATRLGAGRDLVDELLRVRLRDSRDQARAKPAIDVLLAVDAPASFAVSSVLLLLHKAVVLCGALGLGLQELRFLRSATGGTGLSALDFDALPVVEIAAPANVAGFEQLLALLDVRALAPRASDLLRAYAAVVDVGAAQELLATAFALNVSVVQQAAAQLRIVDSDQYRDPTALARLMRLLAELRQLRASVAQLQALVAASPTDAAALTARELLRGKYAESSWRELIKPIADTLRALQRNALVDRLVARDQLRDADDVYERFLIDVQTSSCLRTTRVLQATAAVQLFIQRVLLNLEPGAVLHDDKRQLWQWMHSYRIWEANRKVFLFPENWLLPELRDDRTAIFRQMQSGLTEQEPSLESAREAVLGYLEELGELARVTVIAMHRDSAGSLYVVGRTPNEPYRYFWRTCTNFGQPAMTWTGWEALEVDGGNDFILPFVFEGDFHVAWPTFTKTRDQADDGGGEKRRWEVRLAWMRRTTRGWSKRKLGKEPMRVERLINKTETDSFSFRLETPTTSGPAAGIAEPAVRISCYAAATQVREIVDAKPGPVGATAFPTRHHTNDTNVLFNLYVHCWGKYTPQGESEQHDENLTDVSVAVQYMRGKDGGVSNETLRVPAFPSAGSLTGGNPRPFSIFEARNGSDVTLTFNRAGPTPTSQPEKHEYSVRLADAQGAGYYSWDVHCTVVFDAGQTSPLGKFHQARPVVFTHAGSFALDVLHDLAIEPPRVGEGLPRLLEKDAKLNGVIVEPKVAGNAYAFDTLSSRLPLPPLGTTIAGWAADHAISGTLTVAPASSVATADGAVWFVRDMDKRCFVEWRTAENALRSWPDGQDFVGFYRRKGVASEFGIFAPSVQRALRAGSQPPSAGVLQTVLPSMSLLRSTPYANYNWELFLHAPLAIADHLAAEHRFADARRWLHTVFDPTTEDTTPIPQIWRFREFADASQPDAIAAVLTWLANPATHDDSDPVEIARHAAVKDLGTQITAWRKDPFMPHLIARMRPSAYMWHTFFAYIEVLIGGGDQMFRRDTRESVNEATQLYVLAAKLLGPRPRSITPATPVPSQTYRSLRATDLDEFGNSWVKWVTYSDLPAIQQIAAGEPVLSGDGIPMHLKRAGGQQMLTSLSALAFCIPQNEKLTEFYDRLDDRLFKVRHCQNIDGTTRDLPLFDPPIDPLLLIRAKAAGLDLDSVVADLAASTGAAAALPTHRFSVALPKALELTGECRALGSALLGALEQQDAERLALLRSSHELELQASVREVREQQVAEAEATIVASEQTEAVIYERFGHFQKLLGKSGVSRGGDGLPVVEQSSALAVSTDAIGAASGLGLIRKEVDQLLLTATANRFTQAANIAHAVGGVLAVIPNWWAGSTATGATFGGSNLASAAGAIAKSIEMGAVEAAYFANQMGTFAGYERRQDEWVHESKLALAELKGLQKQILTAKIRKAIAELELRNHDLQVKNSKQADEFMRDKFTSKELFRWMSSQLSEVYFRSYKLALDQARRAETACRQELRPNPNAATFIKGGYWDSPKKGLLAADRLNHDLRRMEVAYIEQSSREFEITKHVSLAMLDPLALMTLKQTNECTVRLSEALFDIDHPGHFLRRIKTVSLTIPCVTGPYAAVNCTLELHRSEIRHSSALLNGAYRRAGDDATRFADRLGPIQAIVTSSGQNDSGLFETNLHDERYLPFEGAGAISTWRLELPKQFKQFDYATISDVVMHVRYTARDGGRELTEVAAKELDAALALFPPTQRHRPLALLVSLRHDFPSEWARLLGPGGGDRAEAFAIDRGRFPSVLGDRALTVKQVDLFVASKIDPFPGKLTLAPPATGTVATPKKLSLAAVPVAADDPGTIFHARTKDPTDTNPGPHVVPNVVVAKDEAAARWTVGTTEALRADLDDIVLVLSYTAEA